MTVFMTIRNGLFFSFFFFFLKEVDSNKRSVDKMVTRVLSDNKELLKDNALSTGISVTCIAYTT
jgi:hypothetical protein